MPPKLRIPHLQRGKVQLVKEKQPSFSRTRIQGMLTSRDSSEGKIGVSEGFLAENVPTADSIIPGFDEA